MIAYRDADTGLQSKLNYIKNLFKTEVISSVEIC